MTKGQPLNHRRKSDDGGARGWNPGKKNRFICQTQQQQTIMKSVESEFIGNEGFKINSRLIFGEWSVARVNWDRGFIIDCLALQNYFLQFLFKQYSFWVTVGWHLSLRFICGQQNYFSFTLKKKIFFKRSKYIIERFKEIFKYGDRYDLRTFGANVSNTHSCISIYQTTLMCCLKRRKSSPVLITVYSSGL